MVTPTDVLTTGVTQYGQPYSGSYDSLNGNHQWAYWCLAYVESTHRNLGLYVTPQSSAYNAGLSMNLNSGRAPLGAAMFFGQEFYYPDGHVALSLGNGACLGTLTDGTGVGVKYWNETTYGYMGWTYYEGVTIDVPDDIPPTNFYVQPDNPHQVNSEAEIGIGGGFLRYYNSIAAGQEPMTVLGYAVANEVDATILDVDGTSYTRTIQEFERGILQYCPENSFPWDIIMSPLSSVVTPA